jgi:hypothetical protein
MANNPITSVTEEALIQLREITAHQLKMAGINTVRFNRSKGINAKKIISNLILKEHQRIFGKTAHATGD